MRLLESAKRAFSFLQRRSYAYRSVFSGPIARVVLKDLAKFCRANETPWHEDPRIHAALSGRHEVWQRIQSHINLPDEELWKLYNPGTRLTGDEDD